MTVRELIGRERDHDAVEAWAADEGSALLTLCGPGGAGKTTLARAFERARGWPLVNLEPCREYEDVVAAVARVLGVAAELPAIVRELTGRVIILDNAEHLVDDVRRFLEHQRSSPKGPAARFVVTSRERIGLPDERVWDIGPLSRSAARELFVHRAKSVSALFRGEPGADAAIDELLDRIDRLPLALELAAVRTQAMSTRQIAQRLEERFDILNDPRRGEARHVSMDACIEWSWELLRDEERRVLLQLSVFDSPFTLGMAEAVVETESWVGDVIQRLVEQSLLATHGTEPPRFSLFATVQRFVERRADQPEETVVRLLQHLATLPAEATPWNILRAFEAGIACAPSVAAEMILKARPSLVAAGFLRQLPRLLERAIAQPLPDGLLARLFVARASVAETFGEGDIEPWLERAEKLARGSAQGSRVLVHIHLQRAHRADRVGEYERAREHFDAAQVGLDELPDASCAERIQLTAGRGFSTLHRGDATHALMRFEEALALARSCEDPVLTARCMSWVGQARFATGSRAAAVGELRRAVQLFDESDDVVGRGYAEYALAIVLRDEDEDAALEVARRAVATAGDARWPHLAAALRAFVARVDRADDAVAQVRAELEVVRFSRDHRDFVGIWLGLVTILVRAGDVPEARIALASLSETVRDRTSEPEQLFLEQYRLVIDALLGLEPTAAGDFAAALKAMMSGEVVDTEAWNDPRARLAFAACPAPLDLFIEAADDGEARSLRIVQGGQRVRLPGGAEVSLARRHLLRRLFLRICEAAESTTSATADELIATGWPDEKMTYESAQGRLYSAIRNLRKLGLEDVILTTENGYSINPKLAIVRE